MRADGEGIAFPAAVLLDLIVQAKQQLLDPQQDLDSLALDQQQQREFSKVYDTYQHILKLQELFDYEDLILEVVKLLETDKSWRKSIQKRFSHIFVDEFQDINYGQYRLLRALTGRGTRLCVIGDPDQAIYGFRGSDVGYFQRLIQDYADTQVLELSRNYRSSTTILESCYQVIRGHQIELNSAQPKRIHSDIHGVSKIMIIKSASPKAEAVAIGRTIENMVGGIGFHSLDFDKLADHTAAVNSSFGDFAVLCRTGEQAQFIAQTLTSAGLPTQLASRKPLHRSSLRKLLAACKVVKDIGNYMDFSMLTDLGPSQVSQDTLLAFKKWAFVKQLTLDTALHAVHRFPIPDLSTQRQQRLVSLIRMLEDLRKATSAMSAAQTLNHIVGQTQLTAHIDPQELQALVRAAEPFSHRCDAFINSLALCRDTDYYDARTEKVAVMTLHASKGLEFTNVFVAGCEDGLIPFHRNKGDQTDLEEERRLFYVAMTRAQERLFLTWAGKRTRYGKTIQCNLSPFVADIEKQLTESQAPQTTPQKPNQEQLSLF